MLQLSIEEIERRLIELQQLEEGASAPVESENEEQINEDIEEDEIGESSSHNEEVDEENETAPSAEIEVDIEVWNTKGGESNVSVENDSGENQLLMEDDCRGSLRTHKVKEHR
ncbi:hypothetical protein QJS10_CPA10g01474 [Acorus calamus]|uniref:Uncharacterized protein n=1 Tax=Acorus calamus TaxID=4465 RepID=A0AAV9DZ74_ACOCL|nr:hypothetical protein QJS10_CPA10g01474 [Acorus calamus]